MADLQQPAKTPDASLMVLDDSDLARIIPPEKLAALQDIRARISKQIGKPVNCSVLSLTQRVEFKVTPRQLKEFSWVRTKQPLSGPCVKRPFGEVLKDSAVFLCCDARLEYPKELDEITKGKGLLVGSGIRDMQAELQHSILEQKKESELSLADKICMGIYARLSKTYEQAVSKRTTSGGALRLMERIPTRAAMSLASSGFMDAVGLANGVVEHDGTAYVPVTHEMATQIKACSAEHFCDVRVMASGPLGQHTLALPREVYEASLVAAARSLEATRKELADVIPGINEGLLMDASGIPLFLAYARPKEDGVSLEDIDGHSDIDKEFCVNLFIDAQVVTHSRESVPVPAGRDTWCTMYSSLPIVDIAVQQRSETDPASVRCTKIPAILYYKYLTENDEIRTLAKKAMYAGMP